MLIASLLGNLLNRLRKFRHAERGNVALTFVFATVPLVAFVGAAVDYSRGNSAKAAMQAAIDATGLILSKEAAGMSQQDLNTKSGEIFRALFHRADVQNLAVTPNYSSPSPSMYKLVLGVTGSVPTTFARVIGKDSMNLGVQTEVVWGVKKLELALALDVTGSMASSNKMTELKKAAKSLLDTLKKAAKKDGDIRVAIVPFNVDVNVGTTNVNATWLDWSDWAGEPAIMATWIAANQTTWNRTGPGSACPFSNGNHGFRCTNGPADRSNDSTVSNVPSSGTNAGLVCPSRDNGSKSTTATGLMTNKYHNGCYTSTEKPAAQWYTVATGSSASCGSNPNCSCSGSGSSRVCTQKTYDHEWRPRPKTAWNGCVRDRVQDHDASSAGPTFTSSNVSKTNVSGTPENYNMATTPATADAFQPHQFYDCPTNLLDLTNVSIATNTVGYDALVAKVDALSPVGNTNVTVGLSWGFHAVTAGSPFNSALPASAELDKVIILLTDGDNTQNRWTSNQADIDARTKKTCDAARAANIKVYTIRVIDGNASLLSQCATKTSMYYNVSNAGQLNSVFTTIAQELANLRIAK